jgi:hypothetical protein
MSETTEVTFQFGLGVNIAKVTNGKDDYVAYEFECGPMRFGLLVNPDEAATFARAVVTGTQEAVSTRTSSLVIPDARIDPETLKNLRQK